MARILIIDDDEAIRRMLRFRLKDEHEIMDAPSPREGLILALQQKPDAILVDLMMPAHTGFEVCQTLTSLSFTQLIPVFVISGAPKAIYKDFCDALGARGYFEKPVEFHALQTSLAAVLSEERENRRREARVRLKVGLKLCGRNAKQDAFEVLTFTDDVSSRGFSCGLNVLLAQMRLWRSSCGSPRHTDLQERRGSHGHDFRKRRHKYAASNFWEIPASGSFEAFRFNAGSRKARQDFPPKVFVSVLRPARSAALDRPNRRRLAYVDRYSDVANPCPKGRDPALP
jgi:DNA-binding response OmpR family regulator